VQDHGFDWDDAKALDNYAKHGVSFETAQEVFAILLPLSMRMIARTTVTSVSLSSAWWTAAFCS